MIIVKAIGSAIETMDEVIENFQKTLTGYTVAIECKEKEFAKNKKIKTITIYPKHIEKIKKQSPPKEVFQRTLPEFIKEEGVDMNVKAGGTFGKDALVK